MKATKWTGDRLRRLRGWARPTIRWLKCALKSPVGYFCAQIIGSVLSHSPWHGYGRPILLGRWSLNVCSGYLVCGIRTRNATTWRHFPLAATKRGKAECPGALRWCFAILSHPRWKHPVSEQSPDGRTLGLPLTSLLQPGDSRSLVRSICCQFACVMCLRNRILRETSARFGTACSSGLLQRALLLLYAPHQQNSSPCGKCGEKTNAERVKEITTKKQRWRNES